MKARRSLLTLVAVFFVALACAFGVLNLKSKASAAEYSDVPTATAVAEEGFELTEASIRLTDGKAAIRFSATVTEDYADAEFVATITYNGKTLAAPFGAAPEFVEGVATLNAYLNFGNASEEVLAQAITAEFTPAIYAKTADACIQAKGSETAARSMRVVANDAYLNWEEGVGYEKEDVLELGYFTNATRSDKEFAVVGSDDTLYVNIPGAPANAAAIYVDDVKVAAAYDEATDKYTVANFATAGKYITIFAEDGKAYSTNVAEGKYTAISNLSELSAAFRTAGDIKGNYALVADISVGAWSDVDTYMYGTFNGLGYALTDIALSGGSYSAFFNYSNGATIKNLSMESTGAPTNGGVLFGWVTSDVAEKIDEETGTVTAPAVTYADTVIDNVYIYNEMNGYNGGCVASVLQHKTIINDSVFVVGFNGAAANPGGAVAFNNNKQTIATNTIVITAAYGRLANAGNLVSGVTEFETLGKAYNAKALTEEQLAKLADINAFIAVDAENIAELLNVSTEIRGYYVITEDIDMAPITKVDTTETLGYYSFPWGQNGRNFSGVLDGADHTLSNVYLNGFGAPAGGMYYGFISPLNGAMTNLNMNVIETGYRGGVIGRAKGFTMNECAIKVDNASSFGSVGLFGVVDAGVVIKDSFLYTGSGATQDYQLGWFASSEGWAGSLRADNFHVVNANSKRVWAVCGGSIAIDSDKIANDSSTGFAYYTDGAEYVADTEKAALPENVVAGIDKIGAIVALNQANIDRAITATGGYWYLTSDIDLSEDTSNTLFDFDMSVKYTAAHTKYWCAAIHFDGCGFAVTGIKGPYANAGAIIGEGAGNMVIRNVVLKGTLTGAGSAANLFVGLVREQCCNNSITVQNVFADIDGMDIRNGGLIVSWSPFNTAVTLDTVFINVKTVAWNYVFTGHAWSGTIKCNDVFIMYNGWNGTQANAANGTVVYQDFNGNTIVPGGDGEFDFACTITSTLDDFKALNDGDDWAYAQEIFGALDAEFFA